MPKRVLLGMSGGIDSSVSASILKEQGYEVIGITLKTWNEYKINGKIIYNDCEFIKKAQGIAKKLNIRHEILDITNTFKKTVVANFLDEYTHGRTPNPCIFCNRHIKFKTLIEKAEELSCDFVATGHYAKICFEKGKYFIKKAEDETKDQSYFLWQLPQEYLSKVIFPLGNLRKKEIIKDHSDFDVTKESFEVCFIPDNDIKNFINNYKSEESTPGNFFLDGKIIGRHNGFCYYTIGQRSGLGVAVGYPVYVKSINVDTNTINLAKVEDLYENTFYVKNIIITKSQDMPEDNFECVVKIRYRDIGHKCRLFFSGEKKYVILDEKIKAITPGQSAVFYINNELIGGAIII